MVNKTSRSNSSNFRGFSINEARILAQLYVLISLNFFMMWLTITREFCVIKKSKKETPIA